MAPSLGSSIGSGFDPFGTSSGGAVTMQDFSDICGSRLVPIILKMLENTIGYKIGMSIAVIERHQQPQKEKA